jgi:RimJ/RimL family protein N-acetyltransferase
MEANTHDQVVEIIQECCILAQRWADEDGHELDLDEYAANLYHRSHYGGFSMVLARDEGRVVGMIEVELWTQAVTGKVMATADRAYVVPEFRERGTFDTMAHVLLDKVRAAGAEALDCRVDVENDRLRDYYESLGFEVTHYVMKKEFLDG